ncbi:hypothetical protein [Streptomyces sp. NPDC002855]|uniref:hypothetical protein n=1 Tax=Streptomyces sp. NPDC002855 TaxID=3154437 RepID=UPI003329DD9E
MKNYFYPKGGGGILTKARIDVALKHGHHVHSHNQYGDVLCEGGNPECSMFGAQLREAQEVWNLKNSGG